MGTKDNVDFEHDPSLCTSSYDNNDILKSCIYVIGVYANSITGDLTSRY